MSLPHCILRRELAIRACSARQERMRLNAWYAWLGIMCDSLSSESKRGPVIYNVARKMFSFWAQMELSLRADVCPWETRGHNLVELCREQEYLGVQEETRYSGYFIYLVLLMAGFSLAYRDCGSSSCFGLRPPVPTPMPAA